MVTVHGRCTCVSPCHGKAGRRQPEARLMRGRGAEAPRKKRCPPPLPAVWSRLASLLAEGASPSPLPLTPDPHLRGFKNQPRRQQAQHVYGQKGGGADCTPRGLKPRSHPRRETPALAPGAPPGAGTADRLLMSGCAAQLEQTPSACLQNGGLERSQENDL